MSVRYACLTGTDGLFNPLLLGAVNDVEDLTLSGMDFVPDVWLNPLLDSGDGFGAECSESAFASADSDGREFPHINKRGDSPISLQMSSVHSTRMFETTQTMLNLVT